MASHADAMFVVLSDPALYEYENQAPLSVAGLRERFLALESRQSRDGSQQWLNWVIKLPTQELIGYVQATIVQNSPCAVAYELHSKYWGQGLASQSVRAVIAHLVDRYQVDQLCAVLKQENHRSMRLLQRMSFSRATAQQHVAMAVERDEYLMLLSAKTAAIHS